MANMLPLVRTECACGALLHAWSIRLQQFWLAVKMALHQRTEALDVEAEVIAPGNWRAPQKFPEFMSIVSFKDLLTVCYQRTKAAATVLVDWLVEDPDARLRLPGEFFLGTSAGSVPSAGWSHINVGKVDSALCRAGSGAVGWFDRVSARVARCDGDNDEDQVSLEGQIAFAAWRSQTHSIVLEGRLSFERRDFCRLGEKLPSLPPSFHHRCFSSVVLLAEPHAPGCAVAAASLHHRRARSQSL